MRTSVVYICVCLQCCFLTKALADRIFHDSFSLDHYNALYRAAEESKPQDRVTSLINLTRYYFENSNQDAVPDSLIPLIESIDFSAIEKQSDLYLSGLLLQFYRSSYLYYPLEIFDYSSQILELDVPLTNKDSLIIYNSLFYGYKIERLYNQQLEVLPILARLCERMNFGHYHWYPNSIWEANIFYNLGYYNEAIEGWLDCAQVAKDSNDFYMSAHFLNNVSMALEKQNKHDSAIVISELAQKRILLQLDSTNGEQVFMLWLIRKTNADFLRKVGKTKQALAILEDEKANELLFNSQEAKAKNALSLAACYIDLGRFEEAKAEMERSQAFVAEFNQNFLNLRLLELEIYYYESVKDYKRSYLIQKRLFHIQDSITFFDNQRQTKALSALALFERRKQDLLQAEKLQVKAELEAGKEAQNAAELKAQNNLFIIGSMSILVLFLVSLYAYRTTKKRNKQLEESKKQISESLEEKETLIKEVHHRVKNNLQVITSILQLQSNRTNSKVIAEALEDSQSRVKSMSLVHQKLYQNDKLDKMLITDYIKELCKDIIKGYTSPNFKLDLKVHSVVDHLNLDTSIPLGLIINELVTNSIKYAFTNLDKGEIAVELKKHNNQLVLRYKDNGAGIKDNFDPVKSETLGLKLIQILGEQLDGEAVFEKGPGFNFHLSFKSI